MEALQSYYPVWHEYHERYTRSEGLDSKLNLEWRTVNGHMNGLLEQYFSMLIKTGFAEPRLEALRLSKNQIHVLKITILKIFNKHTKLTDLQPNKEKLQ